MEFCDKHNILMYKMDDKYWCPKCNKENKCSHRYENINVKTGTLKVFSYCDYRKWKLCPCPDKVCFFGNDKP